MKHFLTTYLFLILWLALVACTPAAPPEPETTPPAAPTAVPETVQPDPEIPTVVSYNLGEATLVQDRFPTDSRFRNMPVRLNGIIAVPEGDSLHPVVVILHGTHPGCPELEGGVDRWPCDPEVEQPNYQGFDYLVSHLAAQGYVALAININAENTFGFGEPTAGERLTQLLDLHLNALSAAATGGANDFGVPLNGRADMQQLIFVGHSRGGEAASWLAHQQGWAGPDAFEKHGYGPVVGVLLLAPAPIFVLPAAPEIPLAVILPACDGDVITQDGQLFYEAARMNPMPSEWATSVWLERANHNQFNEILGPDMMGSMGRTDCEPLLTGAAQRDFLETYATDFLTAVFQNNPAAKARLGLDMQTLAPESLYGLPARVSVVTPASSHLRLLIPASADEFTTHLAGGAVTAENVNPFFCEEGYYTPFMRPGSEPCQRANITIPGNPAMMVLSWEEADGALRFALPEAGGDLSDFAAISLRTAVDPLSPLNAKGQPQAFTVQLTDRTGATASVQTRPTEPALHFPPGNVEKDGIAAGDIFTGRVPLTPVRLLLSDFSGVDLTQISEIALLFDQTPSGSLFIGDVELLKP